MKRSIALTLIGFVAFLLVANQPAKAQKEATVDSLLEVLESDISDQLKLEAYLNLAKEHTYSDSAAMISYANQAEAIATELGDEEAKTDIIGVIGWSYLVRGYYKASVEKFSEMLNAAIAINYRKGEGDANARLGNAFLFQGQYDTASYFFKKSIVIQEELDDKEGLGFNYHNLGNLSFFKSDYKQALDYFYRSIELKDALGDEKGKLGTYLGIGNSFFRQGIYSEALENYFKALSGFEKEGDQRGITLVNNNAGNIYLLQEDYTKALEYYKRALEVREELGDQKGMADSYNNMGATYKSLKEYEQAIEFFNKSIDIKERLGDSRGLTISFNNLGDIFLSLGDEAKALKYYTQSLDLSTEIGSKKGISGSLLNVGKAYLVRGNYTKAAESIKRGVDLSEEIGSLESIQKGYGLLAELENKRGNYKLAYEAYLKFHEVSESLVNQENTKKLARLEAEYEFNKERQAIEAAQLQKDLAHQQELARERWMLIGAIVTIILVSFIAWFAYRSYKIKRSANEQLTEKNVKLKELRENEKRLSEETIAARERELATMAMASHEKNSLLKDLEQKVSFIESRIGDEMKSSLKDMRKTISDSYSLDKSWDSFLHRFEDVHPQFFDRLKSDSPTLTIDDLKLSAYLKIGMTNKEIANVTHLTLGSVKSKINRLKKKLDMGPDDSVRDYMLKYA